MYIYIYIYIYIIYIIYIYIFIFYIYIYNTYVQYIDKYNCVHNLYAHKTHISSFKVRQYFHNNL